MKCKLCLSNKKLIGKSHPLPDFLYKDLYDEKHRLHKVKLPGISTGYYTQTGEYDRHLLCADCDNNILGRLDSYGNDSLIEGLVKYESEKIKDDFLLRDTNTFYSSVFNELAVTLEKKRNSLAEAIEYFQ